MKKSLEKIIEKLPYIILIFLILVILIFILRDGISYEQFLNILKILIWPTVVLLALIFFKKVFTYLFFSMEEFNFFGNKGILKNVQEVIEEKVQQRVEEEQRKKEGQLIVKKIEDELEVVRSSQKNSDKKSQERLTLAQEIFKKYKVLLSENDKITKELQIFRQEKAEREARMIAIRERVLKRRREEEARRKYNEPSPEEIDAAGEVYMEQQADIERGK